VIRTVRVIDFTQDSDGDGVPDYVEEKEGTDPDDPADAKDSDGDGVPDYVEEKEGTDPNDPNDVKDDDKNGIPDYVENNDFKAPVVKLKGKPVMILLIGSKYTDPGFTRTDNLDGSGTISTANSGVVNTNIPGNYLLKYRHIDQAGNKSKIVTRIVKIVDPTLDSDEDGVPDYVEEKEGTDPDNPDDVKDSDGDGVPDYIEEKDGTNPHNPGDFEDNDGDGVPDYVEEKEGTDPNNPDDFKDDDKNGIPNYTEDRDLIAPVITLSGSSIIRVLMGQTYIDPGVTRTDNLDGTGSFINANKGTVNTTAL
jgi:hypothetical protein